MSNANNVTVFEKREVLKAAICAEFKNHNGLEITTCEAEVFLTETLDYLMGAHYPAPHFTTEGWSYDKNDTARILIICVFVNNLFNEYADANRVADLYDQAIAAESMQVSAA
ncbi:MAG: hypothetical protein V4611_04790 [Patescibacteria group bacterium]